MNTDLFIDMLKMVISFIAIGYLTQYEPDGICQTLMETQQK